MANYSYLADGTKLSATDAAGDGLVYAGSLVYRKRNGVLSLESAAFGGGRFVATNNGMEARYFLTDHLGSVREVVNSAGEVLECNDYYPYGMRWEDPNSMISDNRFGYNGKERQDFIGLPYIDYGARQYDPNYRFAWNGHDQLAEKYLHISPFAFCAGNPLKYMDKDGRKIYFAPGASQEFKDKFAQTVQYMNERGTAGDIAALEKSEQIYYIANYHSSGRTNLFESISRTIYWNSNVAYQTDEGFWLSPATVLAHEFGHAKAYDDDPIQYYKNRNIKNPQYNNEEERRNITTTEQRAAKRHKEIKGSSVTRKNHKTSGHEDVSTQTPYETEQILEKRNELFNCD